MTNDYGPLKKMLQEMLAKSQQDKAQEETTRKVKTYEERNQLLAAIGSDLGGVIKPYIDKMGENSKMSAEELRRIIVDAVQVTVPSIDTAGIQQVLKDALSNIKFPEPKVTVNVPEMKMPAMNIPAPVVNFPSEMSLKHGPKAFPVIMMDQGGKPLMFPQSMGASGGKSDFFTIHGFSQSAFAELTNADGRIKVSVETGGSGLTDAELRAAHLDVQQVSGAIDSVYITGASGTLAANIVDSSGIAYSGSNPLPTTATISLPSGPGDGATATRFIQAGDTVSSVNVLSPVAQGDSATALRVVIAGNSDASVVVNSGTITTVTTITGVTNSVQVSVIDSSGIGYSGSNPFPTTIVSSSIATTASNIVDSSGVAYSGSNPVPITGPVVVSSVTATIAAANVDSSGVQYSGSNPVPVTLISGALTSTIAVGSVVGDAVDDGSAPVQSGGIARTANPTAVAGGDVVKTSYDDLGRTLTRPVQVRDLTLTAYVAITTGTETTLRAAVAGAYLDLIYLMGANNSDAAVSVDIRPVTAGNVVMTLQIPASGTAGIACPVPLPAADTGNNWTADLPDITGTTVSLTALFSQEV